MVLPGNAVRAPGSRQAEDPREPPLVGSLRRMRRRFDLILLAHLWALVPIALLWLVAPGLRNPLKPHDPRSMEVLTLLAILYLSVRTILNLAAGQTRLNTVWPYVDVALITVALAIYRDPTDVLTAIYVIPLAAAVATLNVVNVLALAGLTVAGYVFVILYSGAPWTVGLLFNLVIIGVIASLYGLMVRVVAAHVVAAERAEFQTELAREIHDGIQHLLITLSARLELAHSLIDKTPQRAAEIIADERESARRGADELRYLVRRIRAREPQPEDLASALRHQIAALAARYPFDLEIDLPPSLPPLPPAAEHAVFRVIQESLTNVVKHAHATHAYVQVAVAGDGLHCIVRDDGPGFDPGAVRAGGLEGLRERMQSAGGTLEVRSAPGQGTTIDAALPLGTRWPRSGS